MKKAYGKEMAGNSSQLHPFIEEAQIEQDKKS